MTVKATTGSIAGAKLLREQGVISPCDRVVCILTGHQLKDPTATVAYCPIVVENKFESIMSLLDRIGC